MSLLHSLGDDAQWEAHLKRKQRDKHTFPQDLLFLEEFVAEKRYKPIAEQMLREDYDLPLPKRALISKKNTDKKRVVYYYPADEHQMLKLLNYLISKKYDDKLSDACHSFRSGRSVRTVMHKIGRIENLDRKYSIKLDLSSYCSSIPVDPLLQVSGKIVDDDPMMMNFFARMMHRGKSLWGGKTISETMGAIAGTPTAGFFENIYLKDVDNYFLERNIPYFRYGDDILLLVDTKEEQQEYLKLLTKMLVEERGLILNPDKLCLTDPGEVWEYLGVSYSGGNYDLARGTVEKAKRRIRRYAKYLYREKCCREGVSNEVAAEILLRRFNAMFFDTFEDNEFAWNRWYFSVITTSKSLKEIDIHMQRYLRYLFTGCHGKKNYKITYKKLKELGYRSLVHEYYEYLESPPEEKTNKKQEENN